MHGFVSNRKLRGVLRIAAERGISNATLLSALGLSDRDLADPDGWLPQRVWCEIWQEVVSRLGDPAVGLRAGCHVDRGYFGVIDYIVRSSENLGTALERAVRYFRLANTQGEIRIEREGSMVRVIRILVGDEAMVLPPQAAEFALAAMVQLFRDASATIWSLREVTFRHDEPPDAAEHRHVFGCPVRFGADADALLFHEAALGVAMRAPDEQLLRLVERHAELMLREVPRLGDTVDEVRRVIVAELRRGTVTVEHVAARLGMSRRSLHRQLQRADTCFRDLLADTRRALAQRYLGDSDMSIGEIAFLLGYTEASAFHRAFVAWIGQTPGEYRGARRAGGRRPGGSN